MAQLLGLAKQSPDTIVQGSPALSLQGSQSDNKVGSRMGNATKIVLQLPISDPDLLPSFVEACVRDGVELIAIVGEGCREIEDIIDELIVGDGSVERRLSINTSSHPGETVDDAIEFASISRGERSQAVELVKL
jgi:hypothetical protein